MSAPDLHAAAAQKMELGDTKDVVGMQGRVRLQRNLSPNSSNSNIKSKNWMDETRKNLAAYEYLCRVGEAKQWMESCIKEDIGDTVDMGKLLQDGVIIAKVAKNFEPNIVKKIFVSERLQFRHSDNINYFLEAAKKMGVPESALFELTDLYTESDLIAKRSLTFEFDLALSHILAMKGRANAIQDLSGKLEFTDEELQKTQQGLDDAGVAIPKFENISKDVMAECVEEAISLANEEDSEEEPPSPVPEAPPLTQEQEYELKWGNNMNYLTTIQGLLRGHLARRKLNEKKEKAKQCTSSITALQSLIRGNATRRAVQQRKQLFRDNEKGVTKIQAAYKGLVTRRAYQALKSKDIVDINTLRRFIDLVDDTQQDFEEELELERSHQTAVQKIRENSQQEKVLNDLDLKIALLVKNRITLEEVVHQAKKYKRKEQFQDEKAANIISLKSLDRESLARLQNYQFLFYLLQAQPHYLAKLFFFMNQNASEKTKKLMENVVLTLYGYAQNGREEFLLLKLLKFSIREEISVIPKAEDLLKGNPVFVRFLVQYVRGAKDSSFLKNLFKPCIETVMKDEQLNLILDPLTIYRELIGEEELRTGAKSAKPFDVPREVAIADAETKARFIANLQKLKKISEEFIDSIMKSASNMPFGIRFIAREMQRSLKELLPESTSSSIYRVIGNLVYYRYMNPVIVAPDAFDILDSTISHHHRKNLAEVAKILNQISLSVPFSDDQLFLQPLNDFVLQKANQFQKFLEQVTDVVDAEQFFGIDEYMDLSTTRKNVIYISRKELTSIHQQLQMHLDHLAPEKQDQLQIILGDLGIIPEGEETSEEEVTLNLQPKVTDLTKADNAIKKLFLQTKRQVCIIIRIQCGSNLLDVLERPATQTEEQLFQEYKKVNSLPTTKVEETKSMQLSTTSLGNLDSINDSTTFSDLKKMALENMSKLEQQGKVKKENNYEDMLRAITIDFRNKQRRRIQRRLELETIQKTLKNLNEKESYLEGAKQSYQSYIDGCMAQLNQKKTGERKKPKLFTRHYFHQRELEKSGEKVPKFGSFKYTAEDLYKRGVLVSIKDYSPKQYSKITLTLSCEEMGVFGVEASVLGVKVPGKFEVKLEDLLESRFNGIQVLNLFDDLVKVNVNLLIFLVNKKFYA